MRPKKGFCGNEDVEQAEVVHRVRRVYDIEGRWSNVSIWIEAMHGPVSEDKRSRR
jgi:hypothetical protein